MSLPRTRKIEEKMASQRLNHTIYYFSLVFSWLVTRRSHRIRLVQRWVCVYARTKLLHDDDRVRFCIYTAFKQRVQHYTFCWIRILSPPQIREWQMRKPNPRIEVWARLVLGIIACRYIVDFFSSYFFAWRCHSTMAPCVNRTRKTTQLEWAHEQETHMRRIQMALAALRILQIAGTTEIWYECK